MTYKNRYIIQPYFGGKRIKAKRGRGAFIKTPVFGILKRGGTVYTEIVPDCTKATLQGIIRGRVDPDSAIHSDNGPEFTGKTVRSWLERIGVKILFIEPASSWRMDITNTSMKNSEMKCSIGRFSIV